MAQPVRSGAPLDVLQSTLDGIFIEIGNSLRIPDKVAPKTLVANANARLRSAIPRAIETFHQALDDIEADIVRTKAVLLRDLEEARAKRIALENPPAEVVEEPVKLEPEADVVFTPDIMMAEGDQPVTQTKLEDAAGLMAGDALGVKGQDTAKDTAAKDQHVPKETQGPSPPSSIEINLKTEPIDADKKADNATVDPSVADMVDASVDSLLAVSGENNNHDDLNLTFDDMDFSQYTSNAGEISQPEATDFLSTFGNEDFSMPEINTTSTAEISNANLENKKEDFLEMAAKTASEDMMNLDYFKPADESSFDEMFAGDEDGNIAEGDMQHDNYDSAFFAFND